MAFIRSSLLIYCALACIFVKQLTCLTHEPQTAYPTVTIRGFLNFRTTVDGTVIVFTPSSNPTEQTVSPQSTRPPANIQPTRAIEQSQITTTINHALHQHQPARQFDPQPVQSTQNYPTGLVTVLGNTIVNHGLTTELETKVYGTYINGRYAQILKSSSRINEPIAFSSPVYLAPTKVLHNQIQATNINQDFKQFINSRNEQKPKRGDNTGDQQSIASATVDKDEMERNANLAIIKRNRMNRFGNGGRFQYQPRPQAKVRLDRFKANNKPPQATTQKMKEEEEQAKRINQRFHKRLGLNKPSLISQPRNEFNSPNSEHNTGNEQQHKRHAAFDSNDEFDQEFKFNKQKLQENEFDNSQLIKPSFSSAFVANDLASDDSTNEFKMDSKIQVFSSMNLNQNDLFNPIGDDEMVDNHINGTPPIVITRTFSITESTQTSSIVPMFVAGTGLINQTITESFIIRKFITVFKTMPPGDLITVETDDPSIAPKLNETYTFSNLHLLSDIKPTASLSSSTIDSSTNLPFLGKIDLNNPLIVRAALQNQKLAAIYFGLQQLQQQATTYNTITKPTTALASSLVHHTKKISFYDGRQTRTRYLTDSGVMVTSTITTLTTETVPVLNSEVLKQQQRLQQMFANEMIMQNTAMPSLLQTPLDSSFNTKPAAVESLQPMASNNQNQNADLKLESSLNSDLTNQPTTSNTNNNLPANGSVNQSSQSNIVLQPSLQQTQASTNTNQLQAPMMVMNTASLPSLPITNQLHNLQNIAPFLNANQAASLNEVANLLNNIQKNNLNQNQPMNNNFQNYNHLLAPTRVSTTTITTESMITKTSTKVYTLIYNGFSTKYRTVTSTSIYPTTVTQTTTTLMTMMNTISPLDFNSFFG